MLLKKESEMATFALEKNLEDSICTRRLLCKFPMLAITTSEKQKEARVPMCRSADWSKDRITPELLEQVRHPVRREILRLLHASDEPKSATEMAENFCNPYGVENVSYHVRVLTRGELVLPVGERPVRGASEKFVVSNVENHAQILSILADTAEADDDASVRR